MRLTLTLAICLLPTLAMGHGERPQVVGLVSPVDQPETIWVLTNNQGLFANLKDDFRWLCEDAIAPGAGVRGGVTYGALNQRIVAATTAGLFTSDDGGCEWDRADGPVGAQRLIGLWPGAEQTDLVVASNHHRAANDVFYSRDGGRTWTATGLALPTPIHQLLRSPGRPSRVYLQTGGRVWVSDDGAVTFAPAPALENPARLLAVSPTDPDVLFAATEAIPQTTIWRSSDGGLTWAPVLRVADLDLRMAVRADGTDALLVGRVVGTYASHDGGLTWAVARPLPPAVVILEAHPDGRLYAATDVYSGGPWVLGESDDWGQTWRPVFTQFWDAPERWDCGPLTRGHGCCRGLCPGRPPGADCGQTSAPTGERECLQPPGVDLGPREQPVAHDGGITDGPSSSTSDVGDAVTEDARSGQTPDARSRPVDAPTDGCAQLGQTSALDAIGLLLSLGVMRRWRRSTSPRAKSRSRSRGAASRPAQPGSVTSVSHSAFRGSLCPMAGASALGRAAEVDSAALGTRGTASCPTTFDDGVVGIRSISSRE